jgi:peptidoglycan-associated lipoprotein
MVKLYQRLSGLLILMSFSLALIAQPKAVKEADRLFNNMEYYEALNAYKKASEKVRGNKALKAEIIYKQALCYMMFNDTKKAEVWFQKAIKAKYTSPEAVLYLADMLKNNSKYDEALAEYEKYVKLKPDDARGTNGVESCKLSVKWKEKPTKHEISNVQALNSKFDDFSPIYSRKNFKEIIFTSSREGTLGSGADGWTGQSFSDLFEAKLDKNGKWSSPSPFKEPLNSKFNDGSSSLNAKYSVMFFTRCGYDKNKVKGCQIFTTRKKGNTWDEPILLPFANDSFTVGHPWISDDEQTLYFASNMPGGLGGRDIWMAKYDKKAKTWGEPINLGPQVNTIGDELYPTLKNDSTLYFASNGHIGMGGLDMFESKLSNGKWGSVANLKYPLNTESDDFGIIFEGKYEKGYFSSNRLGGKGGSDIYAFSVPPILFTIGGYVYDFDNKQPLTGAKVSMVDKDGVTHESITDQTGSFYFDNTKFLEDNTYNFTATATDYLNDKGTETTVGETAGRDYKKDFFLKTTKKGPIRLPEILYDLGSANLRPESKDSLNGLIQTLRDNSNISIELMSHTDSRGSSKSNIDLSQRRAQSVVDYLVSQKIDARRLSAKGYGETRLLNKCKDGVQCTEEEHQRNRRTEFRITSTTFVIDPNSPEYVKPVIKTVEEDEEIQTEVDEMQKENLSPDKMQEAPKGETPKK